MKSSVAQYPELVYLRRIVKKIPASEMAKALGISRETYLRSERGEREFTLSEAIKIANILDVPITEVFPNFFGHDIEKNAKEAST